MSNRKPSDPDSSRASGDPVRIDDAFAAKLASATPRLGIDASALHYEAGYQAGLAGMRSERTVYRGLVAVAASVALAAFGWEVYVHGSLRTERAELIAKLEEASSPQADVRIATSETERAQPDTEPATPDEAVPANDAAAPAPETLAATSPSQSKRLANEALQRRLLSDRVSNASSMRWSDLYDRSPYSFSAERRTFPTATPTLPADRSAASETWSAFPSPRSLNALIEEGI